MYANQIGSLSSTVSHPLQLPFAKSLKISILKFSMVVFVKKKKKTVEMTVLIRFNSKVSKVVFG